MQVIAEETGKLIDYRLGGDFHGTVGNFVFKAFGIQGSVELHGCFGGLDFVVKFLNRPLGQLLAFFRGDVD